MTTNGFSRAGGLALFSFLLLACSDDPTPGSEAVRADVNGSQAGSTQAGGAQAENTPGGSTSAGGAQAGSSAGGSPAGGGAPTNKTCESEWQPDQVSFCLKVADSKLFAGLEATGVIADEGEGADKIDCSDYTTSVSLGQAGETSTYRAFSLTTSDGTKHTFGVACDGCAPLFTTGEKVSLQMDSPSGADGGPYYSMSLRDDSNALRLWFYRHRIDAVSDVQLPEATFKAGAPDCEFKGPCGIVTKNDLEIGVGGETGTLSPEGHLDVGGLRFLGRGLRDVKLTAPGICYGENSLNVDLVAFRLP